jgi:PAS domain S-box-containing protein
VKKRDLGDGETFDYSEMSRVADRLLTPVLVIAPDSSLRYANGAVARMAHIDVPQLTGRRMLDLVHPEDRARVAHELALITKGRPTGGFSRFRLRGHNDEEWRVVDTYAHNLIDDPSVRGILISGGDVTDVILARQQLEQSREFLLAITDNMTEGMIATDAQGMITFANAAASRLVKIETSELLASAATSVFRLDTPEGGTHPESLTPLQDVWAKGKPLHVDYGSAVCGDGTKVPVALTASPLTVEGLKGSVIVFEDISARVAERLRVDRELDKLAWVGRIRDALDGGRLELFAQPVIDLSTNYVIQHELLVRMRSQDGDLIEPALFLPAAEEYGLVTEIDRWVIDKTARLAARGYRVAFNLSARSVVDPHMLARIAYAIESAGAPPSFMECEITETALVRDVPAAEAFVKGLIDLGCTVALDDFGVGYGGFAYLKRLPVSVLKIDREFVRDLRDEVSSQHVVAAVVSLAKAFGMKTTAEGPESSETLELLRELGVDHAQGFIIGRPLPISEAFSDSRR